MNGIKALDSLPVAKMETLHRENGDEIETRRAIFVDGEFIQVVSNNYKLIQHKEAFERALIEMDVPAEANIGFYSTKGRASMGVYFNELKINDGKLGIDLGFQVRNSYDKSTSLGIQVKRNQTIDRSGEKYIVFMGMRQICSNGMKILVPLSQMSSIEQDGLNPEDIRAVEKTGGIQVRTIAQFAGSVKHVGKNFNLKYSNLLEMAKKAVPYIEKKIQEAMVNKINAKELEAWCVKNNFREKHIEGIMEVFAKAEEGRNIWGAYNSITNIASHKVDSDWVKNDMTERAWALIAVPAVVR